MQDEKLTLDYGRPDPPRRGWIVDIAIAVALAPIGLAAVTFGGIGLLMIVRYPKGNLTARNLIESASVTVGGILLFWLMWRILRRLD